MKQVCRWLPLLLLGTALAGTLFGQQQDDSEETLLDAENPLEQFAPRTSQEAFTFEDQLIKIEGDYTAFATDERMITALGNVQVDVGPLRITADSFQLSTRLRALQAQGNVTVFRGTDAPASGGADARVPILEGDALQLNLATTRGAIFRVRDEVEIIYFIGLDLEPTAAPVEPVTPRLSPPDLQSQDLAIVARRFEIRIGDRMDAWKAAFYHKGDLILKLPFYTTAAESFVSQIPFRVRNADYHSTRGFSTNLDAAYLDNPKHPGVAHLQYREDRDRRWTASLEQHLKLGGADVQAFWNQVGQKGESLSVSAQYFGSRFTQWNLAGQFAGARQDYLLTFQRRFSGSFFSARGSWRNPAGDAPNDWLVAMNWSRRPFVSGRLSRSLSGSFNIGESQGRATWEATGAFSLLSVGVKLRPRLTLDTGLNFQATQRREKVSIRTDFEQRLTYSFGKNKDVQLTYRGTHNKDFLADGEQASRFQTLRPKLSLGRPGQLSFSATSTYDLESAEWKEASTILDGKLHKLWRGQVRARYQFGGDPPIPEVGLIFQYHFLGADDRRYLQLDLKIDRKNDKAVYFLSLPFLQ